MMSDQKPVAASPDLYLRNPKTMLLSLIKLAEACFAVYFAYLVFAKESTSSMFMNLLSNQGYTGVLTEGGIVFRFISRLLTSDSMSGDSYMRTMDTLETILRIIQGGVFCLAAVEGLAFFSAAWTKKGAGAVRAVRTIRLLLAVIALIWVIYDIGDVFVNLSKAANRSHYNIFKVIEIGYESVFRFLVMIGTYLAAPVILIIYHSAVLKMISAVGPELNTNRLHSIPRPSLDKISALVAALYAAAALVTFVRVVGNGTELQDLISYIGAETVIVLFSGIKWESFFIVAVMLVKFLLVFMCCRDFDRIHRQNRT